MQDRFGITFANALGRIIPVVAGLLGALVANLPVSFLDGRVPPPLLALMPIYFWCLVRPDLMPAGAVFAIGLAEDLLSGGPPGVWAMAFLVCYALVDRQRDIFAGLAGAGAILGFAVVMLVASVVAYAVVSVLYTRMVPYETLLLEIGVSVLFYVPALFLMNALQRRLIGPMRSEF